MKNIIYILILPIIFASCNGENVPNCIQNSGDIIEKEFIVEPFDKITVFERIELIVRDEPTQKVVVQTGEFLLNDIDVHVIDGRLELFNNNACNLFRDYGITKIFVSAPNLTEIRSSTGITTRSEGVLSYESLALISEDSGGEDEFHTDGDFNVQIDCENFRVTVNNLSPVYITGQAENVQLGYFSGDARFEGRDFIAQNVNIFQRSSNDMIINAEQSLTGEIRGTGDVILVSNPPVIEVEQFYTGRLIIEE
ncbi:MAG: head GIN domain-containing protein [Bacteroidota bacterium]